MNGDPSGELSGRGLVLGVVGGSGGVGASVLVTALGVRAARAGRSVVAVDGRRFGGGLDVTLGAEQDDGLRWSDLVRARGRVDGEALLDRLPGSEGVPVLSFGPDAARVPDATLTEVVAGLAGAVELVVLDLPRPGEDGFAALAHRVDVVVLVSGRDVHALSASSAVLPAVLAACPRGFVVVRGSPRPRAGDRFGDAVSEGLGLPLLAWLREDRSVAPDLVHGIPPGRRSGPLADTADIVLAHLFEASVAAAS